MIPLAIPNLSGNEAKYLQECVETNFVSSVGPFVNRFEDMVASASGAAYCTATSSGTTGLHAALTAIGVARDDLVILPSFTFIASANAIAHCGAVPWLVDISQESWTLDPDLLEVCLKRETIRKGKKLYHKNSGRRVAAVMPVYTLGTPADMHAIVDIAHRYQLTVVADAAAAIGSRYQGENIGKLADLSVFSFNGNKTVTAGGGGAVVSEDRAIIDLVKHITTTARVGADYHHDRVGFNYRMTNLQAAVGCAQLEQIESFVSAKRFIRDIYDHELVSIPGIGLFPSPEWCDSACWFSGINVMGKDMPKISTLCKLLNEKGIEARGFWKPVHLQPPYQNTPRTHQHVSEEIWSKILTLPCSTNLSRDDQSYVIQTVARYLKS